eukprot:570179-Heterocapsa_arctica.AAC.1
MSLMDSQPRFWLPLLRKMALPRGKRSGSLLVALMEQRKCQKAVSKRGADEWGFAAPTPLPWD